MSARKTQEPAELLDLLIEKAPELRRAGVLEVAINGLSARLSPPQRAAAKIDKTPPEQPRDPLNDPETFGLRAGAKLPGLHFTEE